MSHILIDSEGNSYNVYLTIKNNKLVAIWEHEELNIDLSKYTITIEDYAG